MEFNQLISLKLHSLFAENGMERTEQTENIVRYESAVLHVSLVHNPRENSNSVWIGRKLSNAVEINNLVMRDYFDSDVKVDNLPQETFVDNVLLFFTGVGKRLLEGNERILVDLEKYEVQRALDYTIGLQGA